jgi:hypothetical protein
MLSYLNEQNERVKVKEWVDINEPIKALMCTLTETEEIVFEGFQSYLRIIEEVRGVINAFKGITKVILYGEINNKLTTVILDFQKKQISQEIRYKEFAYNGKPLNPSLWKEGVSSTPRIYINKI